MAKSHRVFTEDSKRRKNLSHAIVKLNFLFAHEQHEGDGRCQWLRQRSQIKNRGSLHETRRRNNRTQPERLLIYDLIFPANEQDCTGEYPVGNSFFKSIFYRMKIHELLQDSILKGISSEFVVATTFFVNYATGASRRDNVPAFPSSAILTPNGNVRFSCPCPAGIPISTG